MRIYRDIKERTYSYVNILNANYSYTLIALFTYNNCHRSLFGPLDINKSYYLNIVKDDNDFLDFFIGV